MIEEARKIIKKRLFATTKDYNALPGGYDYLEQVAAENSTQPRCTQSRFLVRRNQTSNQNFTKQRIINIQ